MSGRNPPLYCTLLTYINRHAVIPNNTKTQDMMSVDYSLIYYTWYTDGSRIGWVLTSGIYKKVMEDVGIIREENCPKTIPTVYTYKKCVCVCIY